MLHMDPTATLGEEILAVASHGGCAGRGGGWSGSRQRLARGGERWSRAVAPSVRQVERRVGAGGDKNRHGLARVRGLC